MSNDWPISCELSNFRIISLCGIGQLVYVATLRHVMTDDGRGPCRTIPDLAGGPAHVPKPDPGLSRHGQLTNNHVINS
jgi:hypothetical protein